MENKPTNTKKSILLDVTKWYFFAYIPLILRDNPGVNQGVGIHIQYYYIHFFIYKNAFCRK